MSDYQKAVRKLKDDIQKNCEYATKIKVNTQDYSSGGGGRIVNVTIFGDPITFEWDFQKWSDETNRLRTIAEQSLAGRGKGWNGLSVHVEFRENGSGHLVRPNRKAQPIEDTTNVTPFPTFSDPPVEQPTDRFDYEKLRLIDHEVLITVGANDETDQVVLIMEEPVNMIKVFEPDIARRVAQQLIFFAEMCELQKKVRPRSST